MKWITRSAIVVAVLMAVLFWSAQPAAIKGPLSAELLAAGAHDVQTLDIELRDTTRKTDANNDAPEKPWRELPSTVWFPADGGNYPLIISSHGFSSMRTGANYLASALARLGYVVIAADYPLTNFFAAGGPRVIDVINQPADVSYLISQAIALGNDSSHPLHGKIDASRIGVVGISLGGMTSTMAGFDPHRHDPRIKAVVSIAGPSMMFGPQYYERNPLPFMMVATPTDALVNYEDNARPVLERVAGSMLVTIENSSHTGFAAPATYMRWLTNPDLIGCAVVMNNLGNEAESGAQPTWYHQIGSREDGVIDDIKMRICETDPLPETMNPIHQHWLTQLAVTSFFEMQFATDATTRAQRETYLTAVMQSEIADMRVERSSISPTQTASTTQMADDTAARTP